MRPIDADLLENQLLELAGDNPPMFHYFSEAIGVIRKQSIISALEKQIDDGWIPCSERLPEYTDNYNVTVGIGSMLGYFEEVRTYRYEIFNGKNPYRKWIIPNNANEIVNVIAWQNLPTKYSESEDK